MAGYTKLFSTIVTSSIWSEDDKTRLMWITMLATADPKGYVSGSIPGLARVAQMSTEDAEKAINRLCAPDQYSRTKEYDGRRLLQTEGGWVIVNYLKYRQVRDPEKRRQQTREAVRRYRERHAECKPDVSQSKPHVSRSKPRKAQAEAEAEAEAEKNNNYIVKDSPPKSTESVCKANFEKARQIYPGKKRGLDVEWENFKRKHKDWRQLLDDEGLKECVEVLIQRKAYSDGFWPMFQTFCNQSRYEEALQ